GTALNPNQVFELPSGATIQIKEVRADKQSKRGKHTLKYNPLSSVEIQALNDGDSQLEEIEYTVEDSDGKTATGTLEIKVTGITDTFAD
ncbi:MAG: VCBS domain-containing protein, partial [Cyanobacteria bacterium J06631_2]